MEWISINHVMAEDGRLLQILCLLLRDPIFQCSAAECLLQIVNRRGKAEDRKQLMILFSEDALRYIYSAATAAPSVTGSNEFHENHYLFLKKLTQVILIVSLFLLMEYKIDYIFIMV